MTKTDDVLLELNRSVANYVKKVHPFQYKNKTFRLIDNYIASPYMKCDVCGHYPTVEVSVIESDNGKMLRVGNECINRLTEKTIAEGFRSFRIKRQNVIANRNYIDQLQLILNAQDRKDPSFKINDEDAENLKVMLEQMYKGLKPTTRQEQIADCYMCIKITPEKSA